MEALAGLRLPTLAAFCKTAASPWVSHVLRRVSAPGREPNNGRFLVFGTNVSRGF